MSNIIFLEEQPKQLDSNWVIPEYGFIAFLIVMVLLWRYINEKG